MMSSMSVQHADQPKPRANGRLTEQLEALTQGGFRVGAIFVDQAPPTKKEFTEGAERVRKRARDLAALFNQGQVSEAMVVLAILLDAEGPRELGKYGIVAQDTYAACLRSLGILKAANPSGIGEAALERIVALAKGRAGRREKGIDVVAIEDLVQAILNLPKAVTPAPNDPIEAIKLTAARKGTRKGGLRSVAGWVSLVVAVSAATAALVGFAGFLLGKGVFEWTSFMRGFV